MDRYTTPDDRMWWEIYPGKLVEAYSEREAEKKRDQGFSGVSKNYIRNEHGPLTKQ